MLDDPYTQLYDMVKTGKPLSFFVLLHQEIITLGLNPKYFSFFNPEDILMTYLESLLYVEENYKKWIRTGKYLKFKLYEDLAEYDRSEVLQLHKEEGLKHYATLKNILPKKFYYLPTMAELLHAFSKNGDVSLLNIMTEEDYYFMSHLLVIDDDILNKINTFKNQFPSLRYIKYDKGFLIDQYHEWLVNTHKKVQHDLIAAAVWDDLKNKLPPVKVLLSPVIYDKEIKIYRPEINDRFVDMDDGLDLFNQLRVSDDIPFIIYKNSHDTYYKIYKETPLSADLSPYSFYFTFKNRPVLYTLENNQLKVEGDISLPLKLNEPNDYQLDGHFNIWDMEFNELTLTSSLLHEFNNVLYVNHHKLTRRAVQLYYYPLAINKKIKIELTQLYFTEDTIVNTDKRISLKLGKRKRIPYIQVKFKNVYHLPSFQTFITRVIALFKGSNDIALLFNQVKQGKEIDDNLKKLKNVAPNIFMEGYSNFCDAKVRPTPISPDKIKGYIKYKIDELDLKGDQAATFKQYGVLEFNDMHFACDYPVNYYPYLKSTLNFKKLVNLDKTRYPALPCCKKKPKTAVKKHDAAFIKSYNVIAKPGNYAELYPEVKYLLYHYNGEIDNQFMRLGVIKDNYSLVHCILTAVGNITDVHQFIKKLKNTIHFSVVKQECYDMEKESILSSLDNYFDPKLFYRLLEEFFNINIYVFNEAILSVPRYKHFHARPYRNRKTVLIYQHETHCELIINKSQLLFNEDMSRYCHELLGRIARNITFREDTYINLYQVDHLKAFKWSEVSQWIDGSGKMRALTFTLPQGKMTLLTVPSQPENLPEDNTIYYSSLDTVLSVMTQPPTAQVTDGQVVGLWFRVFDVEYGDFVPIMPTQDLKLKLGPWPSLLPKRQQVVATNYHHVKKIMHFIYEVVQWLYSVYDGDFFSLIDIINIPDQAYEKILTIPRRFPVFNVWQDYLDYVKLYLPMTDRLQFNDLWVTQFRLRLPFITEVPKVIKNYYTIVDDFTPQFNTQIFLNEENLKAFQHNERYPYLFKYNEWVLIQLVKPGPIEHVLYLIDVWHKERRNLGYDVSGTVQGNPTLYKLIHGQLELIKKGDDYHVIEYYSKDGVGQYAAMLHL